MSQPDDTPVAPRPKVAFVVQRYHPEIAGGAERHCHELARHMARHWDVTVLTGCAEDYRTWTDVYEPGESNCGPVKVVRFAAARPRDYEAFDALSIAVLRGGAGAEREDEWIEAQGPVLPGLVDYLRRRRDCYEAFIFFTYLYWTTVRGIVEVADKAWLIPTAHDERPIHLSVYDRVFAAPRVIIYNTAAEKRFCEGRFARRAEMEEIIGCGVEPAPDADGGGALSAMARTGNARQWRPPDGRPLQPGYLLYVGRVDQAKNVDALLAMYLSLVRGGDDWPELALVGPVSMEVPKHPKIRLLGYVDEETKHALMSSASILVQPSAFESLSLVLLESWLCGTPVFVNGSCEVMREQVRAASGGLYYETTHQFREGLIHLLSRPRLCSRMADAGRAFTEANYSWPVIERKYLDIWRRYVGRENQ